MTYCAWCCQHHNPPICWTPSSDMFITEMRSPQRIVPKLACGDCEAMPCRCQDCPTDLELAWLPNLADHDQPTPRTMRAAA